MEGGKFMSNLQNFNDIYASLAESAYNGLRPNPFPELIKEKESRPIDFSKDSIINDKKGEVISLTKGGTNLPNDGKVYLQPDPTLKITDKIISTTIPKANGGYETQQHKTGEIAKGLLTDSEAGYNSYFVTDNPSVKDSKETYFVIRGSDAISLKTLNDWVNNNANFTLFNAYIPQAKLAEKAMEAV